MKNCNNCKRSIIELHQNFEDWYNSEIPKQKNILKTKIQDFLNPNFQIVYPDATKQNKIQFSNMIYKDHGSSKSFNIKLKNIKIQKIDQNTYLARYQEWQYTKNKCFLKIQTSSVLQRNPKTKKIQFLQIHETQKKFKT